MCGIGGYFLRDPDFRVNKDALLNTILEEIEPRGKHASGFMALTDDGVGEWQKASCSATEFNRYRRSVPGDTRGLIAHTRWATQGLPAFMENNHPIRRGPFYIVHNGHVSNDDELFQNAERMRFGQVDSEAIAARLASFGDLSSLGKVMEEIRGSAAVAALDERDSSRLTVARGKNSPLYVYNGERIVIFGSTREGVKKAHEKHIGPVSNSRLLWLKEGDMVEWEDGKVHFSAFQLPISIVSSWSWSDEYRYDRPWQIAGHTKPALTQKDEEPKSPSKTALTNVGSPSWSDVMECDNCGKEVDWEDIEYLWIAEDRVTFHVCGRCFDDLCDQDPQIAQDNIDAVVEPALFPLQNFTEDDNEFDDDVVSDDPEQVNSIIRRLLHRGIM